MLDGVTDSNIQKSIAVHKAQKKLVTITAVQPAGRFGDLKLRGETVEGFNEKAEKEKGFINGGFFVMNKRIGKYLTDDQCILEQEPMSRLAAARISCFGIEPQGTVTRAVTLCSLMQHPARCNAC